MLNKNMQRASSKLSYLLGATLLLGTSAWAQVDYQHGSFDDYNAFASDPIALDQESSEYFGRFFQMSLILGTGIYNGGLGKMNSAGVQAGIRFVFYFDRMWAAELGGSWARHSSFLNQNNTGLNNVDVDIKTTLIPVQLGVRFSFDRENLPQSISMMNPYLAAHTEIVFRSEESSSSAINAGLPDDIEDKFAPNAITSTTAFGFAIGGGLEFDVYRNRIFLGFDLRYHLMFWPDSSVLVGELERKGDYITVLGTLTHNY